MTNSTRWNHLVLLLVLITATAIVSQAQTFTSLFQFDYTNGGFPQPTALVQGADGNFYGTTFVGGTYHLGTIFKITPAGVHTLLASFDGPKGVHPYAGLVQGSDGNFYGTSGGFGFSTPNHNPVFSAGNVYEITPQGVLRTVYSFCANTSCIDGSEPHGALLQASDGNFYGTTSLGGAHTYGTVFEVTSTGTLTSLYSFCSLANCADGSHPYAGLMQGLDGDFYGTTYDGGAHGGGSVFKITAAGGLTTLYSFCSLAACADGSHPYGSVVQGADGNFYGTTYTGGATNQGTVFRLTGEGVLTTLFSFTGTSGANPYAGLVLGTDNNSYGTTQNGGADNRGTIFEITATGTFTKLYDFCSQAECFDGAYPRGGLVQGSDGTFYGTTQNGGINAGCLLCGDNGEGTIFSLSVGLASSVKAVVAK